MLGRCRRRQQRPFDGLLALELEAQFDEERLGAFEVVDNDEDVVHPLKRHVLPSLTSRLMHVSYNLQLIDRCSGITVCR
jgi:hypothetical protein